MPDIQCSPEARELAQQLSRSAAERPGLLPLSSETHFILLARMEQTLAGLHEREETLLREWVRHPWSVEEILNRHLAALRLPLRSIADRSADESVLRKEALARLFGGTQDGQQTGTATT